MAEETSNQSTVSVVDAKMRRHRVRVDSSATVLHVKVALTQMSLVPHGLVPALVYQQRILNDSDTLCSIKCQPDSFFSLVCVREPTITREFAGAFESLSESHLHHAMHVATSFCRARVTRNSGLQALLLSPRSLQQHMAL